MTFDRHCTKQAYTEPARDATNHVHVFQTMADVADAHQHLIVTTTGPAIERRHGHIHRICVRTSFDPKCEAPHWHQVDVVTGPAVDTPCGEHTHFVGGKTSHDLGHHHSFHSVTATTPDTAYDEEYAERDDDDEDY